MRLFAGLRIPAHVADRLVRLRLHTMPGARWEMRENLHLTLHFIGDVTEDAAEEMDIQLSHVRAPGFNLSIAGTGAFGGDAPHTLWAGVAPCPELMALQQKLANIMRPYSVPDRHDRFMPHVTLARMEGTSPQLVAEYLARTATLTEAPFGIRSFTMFESRTGKHGKWYEPLREYHFAQMPEML